MTASEARRFSTVSLFTGIGGLDAGFQHTGRFELLAALEVDAEACKGLEANRDAGLFGNPATRILCEDITEYGPHDMVAEVEDVQAGDLDVLIGGPPCQAFSTAGRRQSMADPRGQLLWSFLDYVTEQRPRYFVMENVRGLLSAAIRHRPLKDRPNRGGPPLEPDEEAGSLIRLWADDLSRRTNGEYRLDVFEVNAVNYGAPQLRERVIFVGNREGRRVDFPEPTHHDPRKIAVGEAPAAAPPFATLAEALDGLDDPEPEVMDFSERKKSYLAQVPAGGNWRALPEDVQRESMGRAWHAKGGRSGWWRRLSWDLPCPTLTTIPSHASTSMCHPDEVRALSLAEYAAIQEFPPGWHVVGDTPSKYRQIGNAVPVRLARVTADLVAAALGGDAPEAADDDPTYRQVYLRSHVRTRQWYAKGEAVVRT